MRLVSIASIASIVSVAALTMLSVVGCAAASPADEEVVSVDTNVNVTPQATTGASSGDVGGGEVGTSSSSSSSSGGVSEKSKQQQMVACFNSCTRNHTGNWCVAYCDCVVYKGKNPITCDAQNPYIDL